MTISSAYRMTVGRQSRPCLRWGRLWWRSSSSPCRAILASKGDASPPTKLQTFFFGIVITWIWVDPKHDVDLVTRDFYPLDQRPDEVALARPVRRLQPVVECGRKVLQPANNQLQLPAQGGLLRQHLAL